MEFLGLEIGSWSDIVAAVGTVGAVWIALYLARADYRLRFEDKQIEDLTEIYRLIIKMKSLPEMIHIAENHFKYYESDGIETTSSNDNARTNLMKKIDRETLEKI